MNSFAALRPLVSLSEDQIETKRNDTSNVRLQSYVSSIEKILDQMSKSIVDARENLEDFHTTVEQIRKVPEVTPPPQTISHRAEPPKEVIQPSVPTKRDEDDSYVRIPHYLNLAQELRWDILDKTTKALFMGARTLSSIKEARTFLKTRSGVETYNRIFGRWTEGTHDLFDQLWTKYRPSSSRKDQKLGFHPFGLNQPNITIPELEKAMEELTANRIIVDEFDLDHLYRMIESLRLLEFYAN